MADGTLILIVDDHAPFREILRRFLEGAGYSVLAAEDAAEGLRLAHAHRPELIILDLCLGVDSAPGLDALRRLKADPGTRSILTIAMSGVKENPADELEVRCAGADSFLIKSQIVDQEVRPLLRQIQLLLKMRRASSGQAVPRPGELGLIFTLLVIDDEEETVQRLRLIFNEQPYRFLWALGGRQGLAMVAKECPDMVILDLNMPGMSGEEVCRRLREQERWFRLPILILTGDRRIRKEAQCLDLGADDYLIKTDSPVRLMARIRGLLRRTRFGASSRGIAAGGVMLEFAKRRLLINGRPVELTPVEASLFIHLMSASGKFVDADMLFKKLSGAWGPEESALLKVSVESLRRKLDEFGGLIQSHQTSGYRFNLEYAKRIKI